MQTLQDLAYLWYNNYPNHPLGAIVCGSMGIGVFIVRFLYDSWNDNLRRGEGVVLGTLLLLMQSVTGAFAAYILCPLGITIGILYIINRGLSKWGNNYRQLEKSKEKRREEVLRDMLNSDPIFMEKYNELMKTTPKI